MNDQLNNLNSGELSHNKQRFNNIAFRNFFSNKFRKFTTTGKDATDISASQAKVPDLDSLRNELKRVEYQSRYRSVLRSTTYILIVVAAVAVLIATIWLPVLQIYGSSMEPTLSAQEIVLALKGSEFEQGDLIAFYIGNKILIKRCIATPGQWVNIDSQGKVFVDGNLLDEPYVSNLALGDCDITLPYQVPDERYFCLGDNRTTSVDSRSSAVGCIANEQIIGKVIFRILPLKSLGGLK